MFGVRELNVVIELYCVAFCLIGIVCSLMFTRTERAYRNLFLMVFSFGLIAAAGDAVAGIFRGQEGQLAWVATHAGNWLTFVGGTLLIPALTAYVYARITESGGYMPQVWLSVVQIAAAANCLLTTFGVFYTIDVCNVYHRTDWFWISLAYVIGANVINAVFVLLNRRRLNKAAFFCLLFYSGAPILASAIQINMYGLNFSMAASNLGLIVLFLELQAHSSATIVRNAEELAQSRIENTENRILALVSHIHPELVHDTIDTAIRQCGKDSLEARQTLRHLSRYLHSNFEELGYAEPILIARELHQVETYLELVRIAMGDRFRFRIVVAEQDFAVPPLSMQAIAENAVMRVRQANADSACVTVSTGRAKREFWVSVVDDLPNSDGRRAEAIHADLAETEKQLARLCNGTVTVTSGADLGTAIVAHIPVSAAMEA